MAVDNPAVRMYRSYCTYFNTTYGKTIISILKDARFSSKDHHSFHICTYIMRICKMLISYVKLDHTLYSINYMYGNRIRPLPEKHAFFKLNFFPYVLLEYGIHVCS